MSTPEERINEELEKLHDRYMRENKRMQKDAISEIDRTRLDLYDLLDDYAKQDNTISQARINSLLRELDGVERSIYEAILKSMEQSVNKSAEMTALAISAILVGVLSVNAFSENKVRTISRSITQSIFSEVASDNLTLNGRLRRLAGTYNDDVRNVLRAGILQGRSVNQLTSDIRKVYDEETWKIRRLVITEGNTAHRTATAKSAIESDVVKAVQIVDHPGHKRHEQHECYRLARQNPYGWGEGVYRPEDTYIYSPHPQCTASFRYVLKDGVL